MEKPCTLKLVAVIVGYTTCLAGRGRQYIRGGESEAVHGWAKGMKPEVCFVVGPVSFSGTAGVEKKERQGHGGQHSSIFLSFPEDLSLCQLFHYSPFHFQYFF